MGLNVKSRIAAAAVIGLVLLASAAFAAGLGPAGSSAGKPKLTIASVSPLVVVGQGFRSGERLALTATVGGSQTVRRTLAASARGRFTTRFRTGPVCGPVYVLAVGRGGSRAVVRQRMIPPPCGIDPAPSVELER